MLGLRPEVDSHRLKNPEHHPKTHGFTEQLSGRFFVSGVSSRYRSRKANVVVGADETGSNDYANHSYLKQRNEDQMRQDAERLYELEKKLLEARLLTVFALGNVTVTIILALIINAQIKEKKLLRQRRDVLRQRRRIEYQAACRIQNAFTKFFYRQRSMSRAADVLLIFLRYYRCASHIFDWKVVLAVDVYSFCIIQVNSGKAGCRCCRMGCKCYNEIC